MAKVLDRYNSLKVLVVERKIPFNNLMNYLEAETEWLTAPASTRFHLSREQGLLEHSCNVAETMLKMKSAIDRAEQGRAFLLAWCQGLQQPTRLPAGCLGRADPLSTERADRSGEPN